MGVPESVVNGIFLAEITRSIDLKIRIYIRPLTKGFNPAILAYLITKNCL